MATETEMEPRVVRPKMPEALLEERRKTARFQLRDLHATMKWSDEGGESSCVVSLLNISGGGAAVLAREAPDPGQLLRLRLHGESARMEPVEAEVVDTRLDVSGNKVLHLRFAHWVPLDALLEKHRERRLWERLPARESLASLTWIAGPDEKTVEGHLLNISGGGAAFISDVLPPPGAPIWFQLEAGADHPEPFDAVESKLVTTSRDPSGRRIAHIQFLDACPMDLFERAVHGAE